MQEETSRPLSPHLTIWRWGPHMLVSILHRVTGTGLALVGLALLTWWLLAAAGSAATYETFSDWAEWPWALIVWIGLTWAFFQHLFSGLRHFVMDAGAGYELTINKSFAVATILLALAATAALWAWILIVRAA